MALVVVNPPPMKLIVTATFMLLSVHIASGEKASADVTTEASSTNASESAATNDSTLAPLYDTTDITTDDTTMTSLKNSTEDTNYTSVTPLQNTIENTDETTESTYSTVTYSDITTESTNDPTGTSTDSSAYSETAQTTGNYSTEDTVTDNNSTGDTVTDSYSTEDTVTDNNSTDDTVTSTDSTEYTVNTSDTAESNTTSLPSNSTGSNATNTEISFGHDCSSGGKCASNLTCDSTTKTCVCSSDQYYSSNICLQRQERGQPCSEDFECAATLYCTSDICDCLDEFYNTTNNSCIQRQKRGQACSAEVECAATLNCTSDICDCLDEFYFNTTNNTCIQKKLLGQACSEDIECTSTLNCTSDMCDCLDKFYFNNKTNTCIQKKNQGDSCVATSECKSNLTCESSKCNCSDGFYYSSSQVCLLKKNQGDSCGADSECKFNLTCVSGKCNCSDGLYYSSSQVCLLKKNQGDSCGADSECKYNMMCVSGTTCNCSDGYYYNSSEGCLTKREHGELCQTGQPSDQCKVPNTVCTYNQSSNTNKCLCAVGFYWADNSSCLSKNNLNITASVTDRKTRAINFTWTDMSNRSDVSYSIKWEVSIMGASKTGVTVTGLKPGTSYSFAVVTSLLPDGNYPLIEVTQTQATVWTLPDTPGHVIGPQRENSVYKVTFGASNGSVSYTMSVSLGGSTVETQNSTSTTMRFTQLKPATTYNYSLWSYNGNGDQSVPVNGQFTTAPEAPGPVSGLSFAGVQSDTANVTWQTPQDPKGTITGYLVEVALQDSTQCFYLNISCHECASFVPTNFSSPNCTPMIGKITGSGNVYNLELSGLKPYRNYTVKVRAVNEKGPGEQTSVTFQTSIAAPHDISNLTVNSVRNETTQKVDLYITWTPGEQKGPTDYYILIQEALEPDTEGYNQSVSPLTVTGYSNNNYVKYDVLAYWNYNVSVWAHTEEGNSSQKSEVNRTVENYPGPVENLNVTQNSATANIVILTFECPETRSRNGRIDKFVINQTLLDPQGQEVQEKIYNQSATEGQPQPCSKEYKIIVKDIIVERTYIFTVMTVNNRYVGGLITSPNFDVKPQVPRLEMLKTSEVDSLVKQQDTSTEQTKITTAVCSRCLTDDRWGVVRNVGLLVCVKDSANCTQSGRKKRSTDLNFTDSLSWAVAKQQGFKIPYRTTPDNWMPPKSGNDIYQTFVVGENTSCSEANTGDYCNGPLSAGKEFIISVIMCTTAGCTIYQETSVFKTAPPDDDSSKVGAIVGGVLGGLALIAVIGVIIFLARNYTKKGGNQPRSHVENKTEATKELVKKRPVRMRDFNDHVTKLHKDSNLLFQDEFENIRTISDTFNNTCDEAKREQNRVKNRWADILPYDHSRVKLNILSDDDETNDFINANYIPGYSSVREYIATQGPLYSTVPDFWKMVWEQKCKVIVMLSDLTEAGKNGIPQRKVDLYWPENLNEPISYGSVVVEMTNFSQLNKFIIRNFKIIKGEETRKVTHLFLPNWPDFSADINFEDVMGFVKAVRQEITPDHQGPIVVHCSAGVGRSGTFIALDYFSQFVEQHSLDDSIDVFDFVLRMRKNRTRMVQVESQYILIYDGINKLIQSKIKSEEEKVYENVSPGNGVYENLKQQQEENIYANTAVIDDKYVYNNEAFEPDFSHSQKSDKPTTEL